MGGDRLERSDEVQAQLDAAGLTVIDYDDRAGHYRIHLRQDRLDEAQGVAHLAHDASTRRGGVMGAASQDQDVDSEADLVAALTPAPPQPDTMPDGENA